MENKDIARTTFRSEGNYDCIPGQRLGRQKICQLVDRTGSATERIAVCGGSKSARSEANIAAVEKLICSHREGETCQHSSSQAQHQ